MKRQMPFFKPPEIIGVATLNDKSQIVINKEARERLDMKPGDKLILSIAPFGKALIIAKPEEIEKHLSGFLSEAQESVDNFKKSIEKTNEEDN